jgi:hydroxymethylpyrimidine/phosphomethylpyrimidine kinase
MAVPMAETVQNGTGCEKISPPSVPPVERLDSLKEHLRGKWGVKLSMFHSVEMLEGVLPCVDQLEPITAIWDPVLAPTSGVGLHSQDSMRKVAAMLANNRWIVSPNIPEARVLANMPCEPLEEVAKALLGFGMQGVWIRGGHGDDGMVRDIWCDAEGVEWMTEYSRLTGDPRGAGCTATSAWLAYRLAGMGPRDAAEEAVQYIRKAWRRLHRPGDVGRLTFPPEARQ